MRKLIVTGLQAIGAVSPRLGGRLAFGLWRRPLARGRVRDSELDVHTAARVEDMYGVLTYAGGDGDRPVLLVHGWRSRASRYAGFITRLLDRGYSQVSYFFF